MAKKSPLRGLVIRTATVLEPDMGMIFACDLKKEKQDIPHTITLLWEAGEFDRGECNYNAFSICKITKPELGVVDVSETGYYSANAESGMTSADIFENSQPPSKKKRGGGIRSVSEIKGKAYAVGFGGIVYRLDKLDRWARIDDGLPTDFDIDAIHGFSETDIYAVGNSGGLWHFNGKKWRKRELPTNLNLNAVKCAGNDEVYLGGCEGIILRGRDDKWEVITQSETEEDIWDIEWFDEELYISTLDDLYRLEEDELVSVDFGKDVPKSTYQLSTAKGVMWSSGEFDVMSFDGSRWTRIV